MNFRRIEYFFICFYYGECGSPTKREEVESLQVLPSMSQYVEREPFYEFQRVEARRVLNRLQNELELMLFLKEAAEKKGIDCDELDFLDATGDANLTKLKKTIQEKQRNEGRKRYPKRNITKITYCKVKEPGNYEYLLCTQCNKKNLHGRCSVHGLPCFIQDKQTSGRHARNAGQLKATNKSKVGRVGLFVNKADHNDLKKKSVTVDEFPSPEVRRDLGFEVRQLESREFNDLISADCSEEGKSGSMVGEKEKPHQCSQCNKSFKRKYVLKEHMRIHTGEKPYECSQCNKSFKRKCHLKEHLRIHTGEKPHQFSQCNKSFKRNMHLKQHMMIHTGVKPYECSVCGMKFNITSNRNQHMRIHTGEKPFQSSVCGMKFRQTSGLNYHMRIHTGEKPYECSVCGINFRHSNTQNDHMRIYTGEKPYESSVCGIKYKRSSSRNNHLRIHTREPPLNSSRVQ